MKKSRFEKTYDSYHMNHMIWKKTSEKAIRRHVESKRQLKATASYTVKITGPDLTIKTERNAKSSWNKWNISFTKFENSLSEFLFEIWPFLCVFLSNQSDLGSVKLNYFLHHSYWYSAYLKSSISKPNFRANLTGDTRFFYRIGFSGSQFETLKV